MEHTTLNKLNMLTPKSIQQVNMMPMCASYIIINIISTLISIFFASEPTVNLNIYLHNFRSNLKLLNDWLPCINMWEINNILKKRIKLYV